MTSRKIINQLFVLLFLMSIGIVFYAILIKKLSTSADFGNTYIVITSNKSNGYTIAGWWIISIIMLIIVSVSYNKYVKKKKPVLLTVLSLGALMYVYSLYEITGEIMKKTQVCIYPDKVQKQVQKFFEHDNKEINLISQKYQLDFFMKHVYAYRPATKRYYEKDTIYTLILLTEKDECVLLENVCHHDLPKYRDAVRKVTKNATVLPPNKGYTIKQENGKLTVIKHAEGVGIASILVMIVIFLIVAGLGLSMINKKENPLAVKIFAGFIMLCVIAILPFYIYESNKAQKELIISEKHITFMQKGSALKWLKTEIPPVHLSQGETIKDVLIDTEINTSSSYTKRMYYEYPRLTLLTTGNQRMELNLFTTESHAIYRADILRKYLISLYQSVKS